MIIGLEGRVLFILGGLVVFEGFGVNFEFFRRVRSRTVGSIRDI